MASAAIAPADFPPSLSKPPSRKDAPSSSRPSIESEEKKVASGTPSTLNPDPTVEPNPVVEWTPSKRLYAAFLTLAVITLMVALDGTSLSVALPVGSFVNDEPSERCDWW